MCERLQNSIDFKILFEENKVPPFFQLRILDMPQDLVILSEPYFAVPLAALACYLLSVRIYPVIIYIAHEKKLMDEPGDRSSHGVKTPTLGGVGMFVAFSITLLLAGIFLEPVPQDAARVFAVLAATIILVFLGIKDDMLVLSARKKFIGQLLASLLVIVLTDLRISGFGGILGLTEIPYLVSVAFTLFVFMTIINAFNLIDGVDGLAASQAGLPTLFFGVFFLLNDHLLYAVASFGLLGVILGFLRYNLSESRKLFMGDSGSLFLGFMLAFQGVVFLSLNSANAPLHVPSGPIMLLALLSFPLIDCLRVFVVRISAGKSPFRADRNHIHHRFLKIGFSHKQTAMAIGASTITLVIFLFLMAAWDKHLQLVLGALFGFLLYLYPFRMEAGAPAEVGAPEPGWEPSLPGTDMPQRRKAVYREALEAATEMRPQRARNTASMPEAEATRPNLNTSESNP